MQPEYETFIPFGTKEAKNLHTIDAETIFRTYGRGVATCRDTWAYDFDRNRLITKMSGFIEDYNSEVDRWKRHGKHVDKVDDFVVYDDKSIKWSRDLKHDLQREHYAEFTPKYNQAMFWEMRQTVGERRGPC
jgi:predicted helicase